MGQACVLCTILSPITRCLAHCRCLINVVSTNYMWIGLLCNPSSPFCFSKCRKCFSIICSSKTRKALTRGCVCMYSHFSHVRFFLTLWTIAHQIPLSMGFSRQEYWSGFPFLSPGNRPNPGIDLVSYISCIGRWVLSHSHHLGSPSQETAILKNPSLQPG